MIASREDLARQALMGEGPPLVFGRANLVLILTEQLDVPAERDGRDQVFGVAHLAAGELRSEPQGELQHLDPDPAGREEVAQLMEGDQDPQDDDKPEHLLAHDPDRVRRPCECKHHHFRC